jgi:hypothetical protein
MPSLSPSPEAQHPVIEPEPALTVTDPDPEPEPFSSSSSSRSDNPPVVAGGSTMEPSVVQHSREVNVGGRVMPSAQAVGPGQGAALAQGAAAAIGQWTLPTSTHVGVEEAVARMAHQPWPPRNRMILALMANQAGGHVNPSPTEFYFNDATRAQWALRASQNWNQQ